MGYKIPFKARPRHSIKIPNKRFSQSEATLVASAIEELLNSKAITKCKSNADGIISPIFLADKPNGQKRFILNLKRLNEHVATPHFKLEDYRTVLRIITYGDFMTTIDLKDAYFTIPIHANDRKFLRFQFDDSIYEFVCLPFGLSSAPFCFTKLMKPIVREIRLRGIVCVNYLDDFLVFGKSFNVCRENTKIICDLITSLGFIINREKSSLIPNTSATFLGFVFNSLIMKIELPIAKKLNIKILAERFKNKRSCKIRELAIFIGTLCSACPAVKYGWVYTKTLEREKFLALSRNNNKYEATMILPGYLTDECAWWQQNILLSGNDIRNDKFQIEIFTDSSLTGWGSCCGNEKTHGFWSDSEKKLHINILELKAIFYGLKCFAGGLSNCSILVRCDNTTAISYVNRMGSIRFPNLSKVAKRIWQWCEHRNVWVFASYISSKNNVVADRESRRSSDETEWSLSQKAYQTITQGFGVPEVDLFASYINHKCDKYVSWRRDPGSFAVDAFTLPWQNLNFYAFPPFNLILRTLQKIIHDRATGVVVVPQWYSQPWYPIFRRLNIDEEIILKPTSNLLSCPSHREHPMAQKLTLVAAKLSGSRF